jgi:hypothetical protein
MAVPITLKIPIQNHGAGEQTAQACANAWLRKLSRLLSQPGCGLLPVCPSPWHNPMNLLGVEIGPFSSGNKAAAELRALQGTNRSLESREAARLGLERERYFAGKNGKSWRISSSPGCRPYSVISNASACTICAALLPYRFWSASRHSGGTLFER